MPQLFVKVVRMGIMCICKDENVYFVNMGMCICVKMRECAFVQGLRGNLYL